MQSYARPVTDGLIRKLMSEHEFPEVQGPGDWSDWPSAQNAVHSPRAAAARVP